MIFPSWSDWLALKESNARKRAVQKALNGTGPDLPGSMAACPSTNVRAMKSAKKFGFIKNEADQKPDYSFDRWVKMAQELGDDTNRMISHAKNKEDDIDQKSKKIDKDDPSENKETWDKLKLIHKDREKSKSKEKESKSEDSPKDDKDNE